MLLLILFLCTFPFALFLHTDFGLRFRTLGLNPEFSAQQKMNVTAHTLLGLGIAGCLFGLAGGLMTQMQHYMDVGMGIGIAIHGLAR